MKAVERAKLVRSLRHESRRLRLLVLVIGFFLVTLTFVVVSKPDALLFNLNGRLSVDQAPRSLLIRQRVDADEGRSAETLASATGDPKVVEDDTYGEEASAKARANANARGTTAEEERMLASEPEQRKRAQEATTSEILAGEDDRGRKSQQEGHKEHQQHKLTLPTVSNYTIHDATDGTDNGKQEDTEFNLTPDVDQRNGRDRSHQA
ncbi:hypothetical protein ACJX0J_022391, partial [Zea mays]